MLLSGDTEEFLGCVEYTLSLDSSMMSEDLLLLVHHSGARCSGVQPRSMLARTLIRLSKEARSLPTSHKCILNQVNASTTDFGCPADKACKQLTIVDLSPAHGVTRRRPRHATL